ncbi:MAG TPA: hypothetical protein VN982_11995 [Candidatus Dormibacteraeota bacterium]|nr:hypothetical protein [Candidatus Dormibacteraeota bacterium]
MRINKVALLIGVIIASVLFWEVAAHAAEADQSTKLTFSEAIEIPGHVLPAGTYLFKLADENDLNVVRIFNAEGTHLYATLRTIPTERTDRNGDAVLVMAKQGDGSPDALKKWFYSGNTDGHEFVYSNPEEQQLAQDRQYTIIANDTAQAGD